jgi:hypothetical protein
MMIMKKLLTGMLTASIIAALCAGPAFAGVFDPPGQTDAGLLSPTATNHPIPVYGYVGEDALIEDPDPADPSATPEVTTYDINIGVPVKILWAAFVSDGGDVTSPEYKIKNYSMSKAVKVSVVNVTKDTNTDNDAVDKYLNLSAHFVKKDGTNLTVGGNTNGMYALVTGNGTTATYNTVTALITTNIAPVTQATGAVDEFRFTLEGTYDTTKWPTAPKQPSYKIQFKFEAV